MNFSKWEDRYTLPIIISIAIIIIGLVLFFVASSGDHQSIQNSVDQAQTARAEAQKNDENDTLVVVFCVVFLVLLAISIFTNILLFKWRMQTIGEQVNIVPEELLSLLTLQTEQFTQIKKGLSNYLNQSKVNNQSNTKLFEDLIKDFTVLQTALNARDKEIQRLKKGYDSEIYRKYLKRFIRTYDALSYEMDAAKSEDNNQHYKTLEEIREVLMDALEECGVSSFSPKIGANLKNEFGIDENCLTTPAKNKEEEYTIANVIESGFKIQTPTGEDCIKKAKVTVYTPQKEK